MMHLCGLLGCQLIPSLLGGDHRAAAVALHAQDALRADASVRLSPAHLVLHHRRGRLLHGFHGPGHLPRRSYCTGIQALCSDTLLSFLQIYL